MPRPKQIPNIYQLKISLKEAKPPIWRRVLVNADIPLSDLHWVIQLSMGWTNSHMHQFNHHGRLFGEPMNDIYCDDLKTENEADTQLSQLLTTEKDRLGYEYDFGDSWSHAISLEKILPPNPEQPLPYCIKGKGACPPEDCGGIWGYMNWVEALNDPEHEDHEDAVEYYGDEISDPDHFDLKVTNKALKTLKTHQILSSNMPSMMA
ncbi:plasmid pRiA4b ORF-3 family protein [Endozoicomonas sp. Mp262]|uniref:plasmid pRiA4b ORF-3 family protein n=1 Tax=Endozoicomonas sp. Mp262 TaxID=2919499 RepID=UPI0021D8E3B1